MIKVLGADGSYSHETDATSFLIEKNIVIDAGNLIQGLGTKCCELEHIFITHTHFDHIVDLPFIIDSYFDCRKKPLKIYALSENIDILRQYLFNWTIWPNFGDIVNLHNELSLELIPIEYGQTIKIDDIEISVIKANHTLPTCGFKIKKNEQAFLLSGDTYVNNELIELLNCDHSINSLIIDVSLNSKEEGLAYKSKHLTPKLLQEMLFHLKRDDLTIYTYHQKPLHTRKIDQELLDRNLLKNSGKRLVTGDILDLFSPAMKRQNVKNLDLYYNDREYLSSLFKIMQAVHDPSNHPHLLMNIIDHIMKLTHADAASLCLMNHEKKALECNIFYNNTLNITVNDQTIENNVYPSRKYIIPDNKTLSILRNKKETLSIDDIYKTNTADFINIKQFDQEMGYHTQSIVIEPLYNHDNILIGTIQLINKKNIYSETISFDHYDKESIKTLSQQASMALNNT
ncbi:MBL fold metallo-hydrolase [Sulfurovum sp.]|uniref:MBL fold metallo-hydrolase n=1 Tax=Sulfurovum sp. TaxID=1969726 RepID=UPI0028681765|nr:MBL fold metallo-hydrolase [Sulfurovum sp.]